MYNIICHFFSPLVPLPPEGAEITKRTESSITLKWKRPKNSEAFSYLVQMHSPFWGHTRSIQVNQTTCTFDGLNSGTRYEFEVRTVAGTRESTAHPITQCTGDAVSLL